MKVIDLIKILEMADHDSEVMVNSLDWSHRDVDCSVSSVVVGTNHNGVLTCTLNYDKYEEPEACDCDRAENEQ